MEDININEIVGNNLEAFLKFFQDKYNKVDAKIKSKFRKNYQAYLQSTKDDFSKTKSFFIRDKSVNLYQYYVPIGISIDKEYIENPGYNSVLQKSNKIIIKGTGGSGKSILLKHLFLDSLDKGVHLPIFIELRDLNDSGNNLKGLALESLKQKGMNVNNDFIEYALKEGHISFFLDGYDEVFTKLRKKLSQSIKSIATKFPKIDIIITSRPDDEFYSMQRFDIYRINELDLKKALKLVSLLPYDEQIKKEFSSKLKSKLFETHRSFLSNPLLLSIMLLTFGENANIPNKLSLFYAQAFEVLFQRHDAIKGGFSREKLSNLDIDEFAKVFSVFSLKTYDDRKFKVTLAECTNIINDSKQYLGMSFNTNYFIADMLKAVCLLIEDGLHYSFSHRSFQEYFVARFICQSPSETQQILLDKYWENLRSDNVLFLVHEMDQDTLERFLLIPKFERLLEKYGIVHKLGVTHHAKIIRANLKDIQIIPGTIMFSSLSSRTNDIDLIHLINSKYQPDLDNNNYEVYANQLYRKYKGDEESTKINLSDKSYRSDIMSDLYNGIGVTSSSYINSAISQYKILKKKHERVTVKLEKLLKS